MGEGLLSRIRERDDWGAPNSRRLDAMPKSAESGQYPTSKHMQAGPGTLTGALAATSLWEYGHLALPVALPVRFFLFSRNLLTLPRLQRARCWAGQAAAQA